MFGRLFGKKKEPLSGTAFLDLLVAELNQHMPGVKAEWRAGQHVAAFTTSEGSAPMLRDLRQMYRRVVEGDPSRHPEVF